MTKITIILPSLTSGGSERVFSILAGWLDSKGYQVSIVTMKDPTIHYSVPESVTVTHLKIKRSNPLTKTGSSLIELYKVLKRLKPDIIIDPNYYRYTTLIAKSLHIPIILSFRNDPSHSKNNIRIAYRNLLYSLADYSFFQTSEIESFFIRPTKGKCCVIHNPLFPDIPEPYTGKRRKVFVSICRLNSQKNIEMTLCAFAETLKSHPDYRLEIYGKGPKEEELKALCTKLGIEDAVYWGGFVKEVLQRAQDCTAYVSSSDYEGLSNSMIEAMAMGLPVIVTDCRGGGAREIVKNNYNGMLIPRMDVQGMSKAMERIIIDEKFAQQLSENATLIRSQLSIDTIGESLKALIDKILTK